MKKLPYNPTARKKGSKKRGKGRFATGGMTTDQGDIMLGGKNLSQWQDVLPDKIGPKDPFKFGRQSSEGFKEENFVDFMGKDYNDVGSLTNNLKIDPNKPNIGPTANTPQVTGQFEAPSMKGIPEMELDGGEGEGGMSGGLSAGIGAAGNFLGDIAKPPGARPSAARGALSGFGKGAALAAPTMNPFIIAGAAVVGGVAGGVTGQKQLEDLRKADQETSVQNKFVAKARGNVINNWYDNQGEGIDSFAADGGLVGTSNSFVEDVTPISGGTATPISDNTVALNANEAGTDTMEFNTFHGDDEETVKDTPEGPFVYSHDLKRMKVNSKGKLVKSTESFADANKKNEKQKSNDPKFEKFNAFLENKNQKLAVEQETQKENTMFPTAITGNNLAKGGYVDGGQTDPENPKVTNPRTEMLKRKAWAKMIAEQDATIPYYNTDTRNKISGMPDNAPVNIGGAGLSAVKGNPGDPGYTQYYKDKEGREFSYIDPSVTQDGFKMNMTGNPNSDIDAISARIAKENPSADRGKEGYYGNRMEMANRRYKDAYEFKEDPNEGPNFVDPPKSGGDGNLGGGSDGGKGGKNPPNWGKFADNLGQYGPDIANLLTRIPGKKPNALIPEVMMERFNDKERQNQITTATQGLYKGNRQASAQAGSEAAANASIFSRGQEARNRSTDDTNKINKQVGNIETGINAQITSTNIGLINEDKKYELGRQLAGVKNTSATLANMGEKYSSSRSEDKARNLDKDKFGMLMDTYNAYGTGVRAADNELYSKYLKSGKKGKYARYGGLIKTRKALSA